MKHGPDPDRYLKKRGGKWHYCRRVPKRLSVLDPRGTIRQSLKTENVEEARLRRDQLAEADDNLWASLSIAEIEDDGPAAVSAARRRYQVAAVRAMNAGFRYVQMDELASTASTAELVDRLLAASELAPSAKTAEPARRAHVEGVLGAAPLPSVRVSEALETYISQIAVDTQLEKSESQKTVWLATKNRSIATFIDVIGDLPIGEISREQANAFREYWTERLRSDGPTP